jgi:16S rRNA (guanine(966)-N(2))-methyltransferase RsmD
LKSKKNKLITHIIAGKYKGKTLDLPSLNTTRSSKSILKESFFNVLQFDIIDKIFIEAFGGSGSVGLEAISRGAKEAFFCEIDKNSYRILEKNCSNIEPNSCNIIFGDTFEKLPQIIGLNQNKNEESIIYIDPPFDFRDGMENIYEKCFKMVEQIDPLNVYLVVFEHFSNIETPQDLGYFSKTKTKKFGKSSLSYYLPR